MQIDALTVYSIGFWILLGTRTFLYNTARFLFSGSIFIKSLSLGFQLIELNSNVLVFLYNLWSYKSF